MLSQKSIVIAGALQERGRVDGEPSGDFGLLSSVHRCLRFERGDE
jgi:hypothetical protein